MNTLVIIFTMLTVTFIMQYVMKSSNKPPITDATGKMTLKMNRAFAIIGIIGLLFAVIIIIIALNGTVKTSSDLIIVICMVAFFSILSTLLILSSKNQKLEADQTKIRSFGITGKSKEIYWNAITGVKLNKLTAELCFINAPTKIKAYLFYVGFSSFLELVKQKLNASLYQEALKEIDQLRHRF